MAHRPNKLADETSPYLLQHAKNPVAWYPWGPEALERAKSEIKPILLSIGYAACHWCHVMERESFENDAIAALMNEHFVCIKVDREERPDLDEIYMAATIALSGSGGWPMTVFLTPEQEPFFAGTYFPPEDRHGRPGFPSLLSRVADLWRQDRGQLLEQAHELTEHVRAGARLPQAAAVSAEALRVAARQLEREFDPSFGGFGRSPKFPPSSALALLLRYHRRSGDASSLHMVERTLDGMSSGGMFDQLGGGFARYSVDEKWLVPHFEKMLYDNAQLAEAYLEGYQATGNVNYRRVARATLDYVLSEMQAPSGGFFSSSDADSEGEEGKFFVFTREEIKKCLGEPDATRFCEFYGVSDAGNFEGKNILTLWRSQRDVAKQLGISEVALNESIERGRARLLELRASRVAPAVDDKIIVSWNGLMIRALSEGALVLGDSRYLEAARRAASYILEEMARADGGLYRTARSGTAHLGAYLEDYAFLADGLLSLYEASGDSAFLRESTALAERLLADFSDEGGGAFFHTAQNHETLIARSREGHDGALPSGNAVACRLLTRLAAHTGRGELRERAVAVALAFGAHLKRAPRAFCTLLCAVDGLLETPLEIVLAGDDDDETLQELAGVLATRFLPHRVLARVGPEGSQASPLTAGKGLVAGRAAAFLCEGYACQPSVGDADSFARLLDEFEERARVRGARELGRGSLEGRATATGTYRARERSGLPEAAFREFDGLLLSRLAFGSYRVGLDQPRHRQALSAALLAGWNVVDTSPAFALGDSERLVGEVLSELVAAGTLARDEVVLVSKIGVALAADAEQLARRSAGRDLPFTVSLRSGDPIERGAFCLEPEFVRAQIRGSLDRLGVEHLDFCVIQSPEHLLLAGVDRSEFERALRETFALLEDEVAKGRIGRYGVMTNTANETGAPERVDPLRLLELAREVAGVEHHFRLVELPINLVERAALAGSAQQQPLATRAAEAGLLVVACRPLSAFANGALLRLVEPTRASDGARATGLSAARYRVASLEAEFETTLAPALRIAGLLGPDAVLPLTQRLGQVLERVETLEQFEQAESTLITPKLRAILAELDRVHQGFDDGNWRRFRTSYVQAVGTYLACVREVAADKNRLLLSELHDELAGTAEFGAQLSAGSERPWNERALGALLGASGVGLVATGARNPGYVESATRLLSSV